MKNFNENNIPDNLGNKPVNLIDQVQEYLNRSLKLPKPLNEKELENLTIDELRILHESSWWKTTNKALILLGKLSENEELKNRELKAEPKKNTDIKNNNKPRGQKGIF